LTGERPGQAEQATGATALGFKAGESESERQHRERFGLLLASIVAAFAIQGIATPGRWGEIIVVALLGATLLLAIAAAEGRLLFIRAGALFVLAALTIATIAALSGHSGELTERIVNGALVAAAPPAMVIGIVRSLRVRQAVTVEAVFGVLGVYLMIGMFFAAVYGVLGNVEGPFFTAHEVATVSKNIYFSFATLTTVGYGDLTARTNLGHTLSVSEALVGQIYLVTVVSLIVANLGRRAATPPG
jgi:hypothetical protein